MTRILNRDRLRRKLKDLPLVARTMIRQAMERAADEVVVTMMNLVPVDDGKLRDSIGWTWGDVPKGALALVTVANRDGDMVLTIYAGDAEAYYARWVEFGTAPHLAGGKFEGSTHPGTAAQPFFYVSWRANRKRARRLIAKAARDSAKKVAGR